jgi:hypothetical protein
MLREIVYVTDLPTFPTGIIDLFDSLVTEYLKLLLKIFLNKIEIQISFISSLI